MLSSWRHNDVTRTFHMHWVKCTVPSLLKPNVNHLSTYYSSWDLGVNNRYENYHYLYYVSIISYTISPFSVYYIVPTLTRIVLVISNLVLYFECIAALQHYSGAFPKGLPPWAEMTWNIHLIKSLKSRRTVCS